MELLPDYCDLESLVKVETAVGQLTTLYSTAADGPLMNTGFVFIMVASCMDEVEFLEMLHRNCVNLW